MSTPTMDKDRAATLYPRWWGGVKKNHVEVQQKFIPAVLDVETCYGIPFATGFYNGACLTIFHGLKRDHLRWFLDQLERLPKSSGTLVLAGHFFSFDFGVLLWRTLNPFGSHSLRRAPRHSHFSFLDPRCTIEIFWGRPFFGTIRFGDRTVHILDTFAFFPMSLRWALRAIKSKYRKLRKPKLLGKRVIPLKELEVYLSGDLHGAFDLLVQIIEFHKKYRVRLCYSSPMMAGRIFRHYYLKKNFPIPSRKLLVGSILSYHGGKNSFVADPGRFERCYDLDINSAYAWAMGQLPNFESGRWRQYRGGEIREAGIYKIAGRFCACRWGLFYSHEFRRIPSGRVRDLWVTGYELKEGIESGEFAPEKIEGWYFQENKNAGESAFKKYVEEFYERKQSAADPAWREFFKHMLTDLYGKFIARTEDDSGNFVAGSMFDPTIASLITGKVRARIHSLEHKYNALHTATDGFITQRDPDPADIGGEIGKLKMVNFGPCIILRNKLYLHYDESGKLRKTGLHGFELGPRALLRLWRSANRVYRIERLVRWAEAWHIGIPPGTPVSEKKELHLNGRA